MQRALIGVSLLTLSIVAGCAPQSFERGESYYADRYHVRDAASRRVDGTGYLRFNALMISDLDDALEAGRQGDSATMRHMGELVLRAATSLAQTAAENEIRRMPADGRARLAALAGCDATPEALAAEFRRRSQSSLDSLLDELARMEHDGVYRRLAAIRQQIEPAIADQGRLGRQLALGFGALPAWMGVEGVEQEMKQRHDEAQGQGFERAVAWDPAGDPAQDEFAKYAPILIMQWPEQRNYPAEYDRFGEVYLTGSPDDITVNINTSHAVVYAYGSEAKVHGRRYRQLCYAWWYPHRPAMTENDPVAGRIDGDTLRVTLGRDGRPAVFEVIQSCGCGHLVYVAQHVEELAREQFGAPVEGKTLAVEQPVTGKRDLYVMGTVEIPRQDPHPVVRALAGYHSIRDIGCVAGLATDGENVIEEHAFDLRPYDVLDRLPLGDGVASMFGPDGLVHNAGRAEGFLLAPTGMLSAGQPRKRGTQMIRWDEYSFDDPTLLDKTLRLPDAM
jgi:hypothetical protein